jgi:hypothetical protein
MHQAVYRAVKMISKKRRIDSKIGNDKRPANTGLDLHFPPAATCRMALPVA